MAFADHLLCPAAFAVTSSLLSRPLSNLAMGIKIGKIVGLSASDRVISSSVNNIRHAICPQPVLPIAFSPCNRANGERPHTKSYGHAVQFNLQNRRK